MDPSVTVAAVGGVALVVAAWIGNPSHRRLKRIEGEFSRNGGSTAKDSLDRIERGVSHLTGRFDQHIQDSEKDKELAHREALRMWAAIEAVAKADPPNRGD